MIFNSVEFLVFLPLVFFAYHLLKNGSLKTQNFFLLVVSYIFYGWWDYRFLGLIAFSTLIDFIVGQKIELASNAKSKLSLLMVSLVVNLGLLGFFKYYNFFVESLTSGLASIGVNIDPWSLDIILPVGISFYTFQTLSYSIDIYKGKIKASNDFIAFGAFVSFFPQLVAGPIERASNLLPQFEKRRTFDLENAKTGITMLTYGLFRKIVIADRLAVYVNEVFGHSSHYQSLSLIIATIFFAFQIYCDFSGYSLIARGVAKLLGFELMVNFSRPYLATNLPDFWRRWHISLSTWFKDYLYIPLGGNRVSRLKNYFNIVIVFVVSGLWHGANWTFIIWGAIHGVFQVISLSFNHLISRIWPKFSIPKFISWTLVFGTVCFAWIFFRAQNVHEALSIIKGILDLNINLSASQLFADQGPINFAISLAGILILLLTYILPLDLNFKNSRYGIGFNVLMILLILFLGMDGKAEFIYFQF